MTFSFNAVGTAEEVAEQLASVQTDNVLGARLAETLAEQLTPELLPQPFGDGEYRYVVKVFGHSGGSSALHLKADVEAVWVPVVPPALTVPEASGEIGGELIPAAGLSDED